MTKIEFVVIGAILALGFGGASIWRYAKDESNAKHCHEMMDGMAVKEGTSGNVVCIRRDAVLRIYR